MIVNQTYEEQCETRKNLILAISLLSACSSASLVLAATTPIEGAKTRPISPYDENSQWLADFCKTTPYDHHCGEFLQFSEGSGFYLSDSLGKHHQNGITQFKYAVNPTGILEMKYEDIAEKTKLSFQLKNEALEICELDHKNCSTWKRTLKRALPLTGQIPLPFEKVKYRAQIGGLSVEREVCFSEFVGYPNYDHILPSPGY